jgi:signal peptidase I
MSSASFAAATRSVGRRAPLRRPTEPRLVVLGVALLLAAATWWALAPPTLGGKTSFAVVDGTSMLPHLRRGDLVVVRRSSTYRVGDVVAYHSELLHRVVLHRIVAIEDGRYTFKGDNNTWLDPERPTARAIIGKRWSQLPQAGHLTGFLHDPLIAAALAVLLALAWGLGGARAAEGLEGQ